jgi:NADH-quinone oxidoreductase subunit L
MVAAEAMHAVAAAQPTTLLRWIIALPFAGALFNCFFGQRTERAVALVAPGMLLGSFVVSVLAVLQLHGLGEGAALHDAVYTWLQGGDLTVAAGLRLDALSAVMCLFVTGVAFLIHVYSVGYMHGDHRDDGGFARYFAYLNLFVTAMLILVLADNLVLLFVGWEGVGLCSYLLIGFWFSDTNNANAGKKAFLVNRIGDAAFLVGLFLLWQYTRTFDVATISAQAGATLAGKTLGGWSVATVIGLLLFVGATGKSAQIPLFVWLPDAMAGPTPVSALIHAATMVTAGVYMVARMHAVYALAPTALAVVAIIGAATALLAAIIGTAQNDIKKVLAYSTVSQLGYMFLGLGVGLPGAAIFHVVTHAFFKGLLFLCSGSVIHGMGGEQDMRKMGGLRAFMPITFWTMTIGTLAIAGVPPLAGFFSKDEIILGAFAGPHAIPALGWVAYAAAFLTAFYMGRMLFLTFFGERRADAHVQHHIHESPALMWVPLVVLAALSIGGGFLPIPELVEQVTGPVHLAPAPLSALILAVSLGVGGLAVAWFAYLVSPTIPDLVAGSLGGFYRLVADKFRIDELYDAVVVRPLFRVADGLAVADQEFVDGAVLGAGSVVEETSRAWRRLQTGNVQHYALSFLVGVLVLVYWMAR